METSPSKFNKNYLNQFHFRPLIIFDHHLRINKEDNLLCENTIHEKTMTSNDITATGPYLSNPLRTNRLFFLRLSLNIIQVFGFLRN